MDRGRRAELFGNAATYGREKSRDITNHFNRVNTARPVIDNASPADRMRSSVSKATQIREDRLEEIQHENARLSKKISTMASHAASLKLKKQELEWRKVRSTKKRLNEGVRRREHERIFKENQKMLSRLQGSKATIKKVDVKRDRAWNKNFIQAADRRRAQLRLDHIELPNSPTKRGGIITTSSPKKKVIMNPSPKKMTHSATVPEFVMLNNNNDRPSNSVPKIVSSPTKKAKACASSVTKEKSMQAHGFNSRKLMRIPSPLMQSRSSKKKTVRKQPKPKKSEQFSRPATSGNRAESGRRGNNTTDFFAPPEPSNSANKASTESIELKKDEVQAQEDPKPSSKANKITSEKAAALSIELPTSNKNDDKTSATTAVVAAPVNTSENYEEDFDVEKKEETPVANSEEDQYEEEFEESSSAIPVPTSPPPLTNDEYEEEFEEEEKSDGSLTNQSTKSNNSAVTSKEAKVVAAAPVTTSENYEEDFDAEKKEETAVAGDESSSAMPVQTLPPPLTNDDYEEEFEEDEEEKKSDGSLTNQSTTRNNSAVTSKEEEENDNYSDDEFPPEDEDAQVSDAFVIKSFTGDAI